MIAALTTAFLLAASATVHVKVDGDGYLRFAREGRAVYAKEANLVVGNGILTHESGCKLLPSISVPGSPTRIEIDLEGHVMATYGGDKKELGRIVLALFGDKSPIPDQDGLMVSPDRPKLGSPGEETCGVIRMAGDKGSTSVGEVKSPTNTVKTAPKQDPPKQTVAPKTGAGLPSESFLKNGGVQIVLKESSEVETTTYCLGQIAEVFANGDLVSGLTGVELGQTPPLGVENGIDRLRIKSRIKAAGYDPEKYIITGPLNPKVRRRGQHLTSAMFEEQALAAAKAKIGQSADLGVLNPGPEMVVPMGQTTFVADSVTTSGAQTNVVVAVYVDGRRFNSRTLQLINRAPIAAVKVGTNVKIRVISNGAVVEISGRVKSVDPNTNQIVVTTDTGATLVGAPASGGIVEVKL